MFPKKILYKKPYHIIDQSQEKFTQLVIFLNELHRLLARPPRPESSHVIRKKPVWSEKDTEIDY
jgi:hypothetical protein